MYVKGAPHTSRPLQFGFDSTLSDNRSPAYDLHGSYTSRGDCDSCTKLSSQSSTAVCVFFFFKEKHWKSFFLNFKVFTVIMQKLYQVQNAWRLSFVRMARGFLQGSVKPEVAQGKVQTVGGMLHNFYVVFYQEFCNPRCLMWRCVILIRGSNCWPALDVFCRCALIIAWGLLCNIHD